MPGIGVVGVFLMCRVRSSRTLGVRVGIGRTQCQGVKVLYLINYYAIPGTAPGR